MCAKVDLALPHPVEQTGVRGTRADSKKLRSQALDERHLEAYSEEVLTVTLAIGLCVFPADFLLQPVCENVVRCARAVSHATFTIASSKTSLIPVPQALRTSRGSLGRRLPSASGRRATLSRFPVPGHHTSWMAVFAGTEATVLRQRFAVDRTIHSALRAVAGRSQRAPQRHARTSSWGRGPQLGGWAQEHLLAQQGQEWA